MTVSEELAYATGTELAARIRRRDLSPVELLEAVIARIEARKTPASTRSSSPRSTRPATRRSRPSRR